MQKLQHDFPQERSQHSRFSSQKHCFACKQPGYLNICSKCPKVFHSTCLTLPSFHPPLPHTPTSPSIPGTWTCPFCTFPNFCPICSKQTSIPPSPTPYPQSLSPLPSDLYKCTVCLRNVHSSCYSHHSQNTHHTKDDDDDDIIMRGRSQRMIVCLECLKAKGVEFLIMKKIVGEMRYYLVRPAGVSFIHSVWVTCEEVVEVVEERGRRGVGEEKIRKYEKEFDGYKEVEKVLMVRLGQSVLERVSEQQYLVINSLVAQLDSLKSSTILPHPLKLLIKWKHLKLSQSTWQDISILHHLRINYLPSLNNYLSVKLRNYLSRLSSQPTPNIKNQNTQKQPKRLSSSLSRALRKLRRTKIIYHEIASNEISVHNLAELIKTIHCRLLKNSQRILFLSNKGELYYDFLKLMLTGLNVVLTSKGMEEGEREDQMDVEVWNGGECMVGLWIVEDEEIVERSIEGMEIGLVIVDDSLEVEEVKRRWRECYKVVLIQEGEIMEEQGSERERERQESEEEEKEEEEEVKKEMERMCNMEVEKEIIPQQNTSQNKKQCSHQIQQTSFVKILLQQSSPTFFPFPIDVQSFQSPERSPLTPQFHPNPNPISPTLSPPLYLNPPSHILIQSDSDNDSNTSLPLSSHPNQIQRLYILKFVLQYGIDFPTFDALFLKLTSLSSLIFPNTPSTFNLCYTYLDTFVSYLLTNKQDPVYFRQQTPQRLKKRIADLSHLFRIFEKYKEQPWKLPIKEQFVFANKGAVIFKSDSWSNVCDLRLIKMIRRYGYGNWKEVCENFENLEGEEGKEEGAVRERGRKNGHEYLRKIIWPALERKMEWKDNIETCVKIRAGMLLGNTVFEQEIRKDDKKREKEKERENRKMEEKIESRKMECQQESPSKIEYQQKQEYFRDPSPFI